jgi:hypothetical protein
VARIAAVASLSRHPDVRERALLQSMLDDDDEAQFRDGGCSSDPLSPGEAAALGLKGAIVRE